jgi:hypothetical protein
MKDGKIYKEGTPEEIITPEVLNPVFDHDFHIVRHDKRPVCLYYDHADYDCEICSPPRNDAHEIQQKNRERLL